MLFVLHFFYPHLLIVYVNFCFHVVTDAFRFFAYYWFMFFLLLYITRLANCYDCASLPGLIIMLEYSAFISVFLLAAYNNSKYSYTVYISVKTRFHSHRFTLFCFSSANVCFCSQKQNKYLKKFGG